MALSNGESCRVGQPYSWHPNNAIMELMLWQTPMPTDLPLMLHCSVVRHVNSCWTVSEAVSERQGSTTATLRVAVAVSPPTAPVAI